MASLRGIEVGRRYPLSELRRLITQESADALKLEGYVLRFDTDSRTWSVVHWTKATGGGGTFGKAPERPRRLFISDDAAQEMRDELPPIVKRTPQQRVDSMAARLEPDFERIGTLPGVPETVVDSLADGAETKGARLRTIAQSLIEKAETEFEKQEFKKVVRSPRTGKI